MLDQVGDAVGEHPGLARTGAGHDEQRAAGVGHRLPLHRVQPDEQVVGAAQQRGIGIHFTGGR